MTDTVSFSDGSQVLISPTGRDCLLDLAAFPEPRHKGAFHVQTLDRLERDDLVHLMGGFVTITDRGRQAAQAIALKGTVT